MTVLVTGATGLVGSNLVEALIQRGEPVRALVCPGDSGADLLPKSVEVYWGDLRDPKSLEVSLRGAKCVLHCAAKTGPWGPRADYEAVNVSGLKKLVESALHAGVERFVHVSSHTVLGNDVGGTADEATKIRVEPNPYSWSKVMGERVLETLIVERQAPVIIVRPGMVYGPGDVSSFARFASMIQRGRMIVIGSGHNHLPLIFVRDVAKGILAASESPGAVGKAYILVNDEPVTQRDYLVAIANELGVPAPTWHVPYRAAMALGTAGESVGYLLRSRRPPPLSRYGIQLLGGENCLSIGRARRELGFAPEVSLSEGVRISIAWYRNRDQQRVLGAR